MQVPPLKLVLYLLTEYFFSAVGCKCNECIQATIACKSTVKQWEGESFPAYETGWKTWIKEQSDIFGKEHVFDLVKAGIMKDNAQLVLSLCEFTKLQWANLKN